MKTTPTIQTRRLGLRSFFHARTLLAVSALAALAVTTRSLAQAPTFNTLVTTYTGNPNYEHPQNAVVGDFNGDGKLDAVINVNSPNLRLMLGNGNGTFTQSYITVPGASGGPMKAVDLNGDGKLDVIMGSGQGNLAPSVLLNTGNDAQGVPQFTVTSYAAMYSGIRSLTVGDLNGDGKPDFVIGNANGEFKTYLNNGDGTFTGGLQRNLLPGAGGPSVGPGVITDLNGDGKADYLVTSNQNNAIDVFVGNGDGTFQATPTIISATNGMWPVVSDLNNDGKPDFLAVDIGTGMLQVYLNNGDGTFSGPTLYATGLANPCSLVFTDMNGDGKLDVVTSDYYNGSGINNVAVLLGNGNGTFGAANLYNSTQRATDLAVGDFNGDGKLDIATVGYNDDTYGVLLNTTVTISPPAVASATATPGYGLPFSYQISATNSPVTYGATGLPTGLSVNPGTGLISGTPTQSGSFAVDLSATNGGGTGHGTLSLTIAPLVTQTLTILGGSGTPGTIAPNVEYYNPATGNWQPAYLTGSHPWGFITGTNSWINFKTNTSSDPGAGPTTNQTLWYLYRVRFTVPADAVNPQMTFSANADNFTQVAINGVTTGGSTQFINNANMPNVIVGGPGVVVQFHADSASTQSVHPGENTITLNIGDWGGLNGFNFRIDLSMLASQPPVIVTPPPVAAPVVASASATGTFGTAFSYQISATNSPTGYGASGLPSGLSVDASGLISGTPTQTGSFTVGLSATNTGGTGNGTLSLTIGKKTATIALTDLSYTYDGAAKSATATTTPAGLGVTFNSGNSFTNAGTYPVIASISDNNYTGSASADLVIAKATSTTTTVGAGPFTYDGTTHAGGSGAVSGAGVLTGSATLSYAGDQINAGSYTVTASYAGDANHTASAGLPVTIVINKATATVVVTPYTVEYDGQPHSATVTSITGVAGQTGATVGAVTLNTTHTSVGIYADTWSFAGANYNSIPATPITDVIKDTTPPAITVPVVAAVEATSATGATVNYPAATATDLVGVTSLTYSKAAGTTFSIGTTTVTVTAKDAAGNTSTAAFNVTVKDSTAPALTATMTPRGGGDDESSQFFTIAFAATDAVGVKTLTGVLNGVTVTNGQVVQLQTIKSGAQSVKRDDGRLQIKATSFALVVTATDAAGNTTTKTVVPVFVKNGNDDEDKKGGDDKKGDDKSDKSGSDDKGKKSGSESKGGKS